MKVGANSKIIDWRVLYPIKYDGRRGLSILIAVWIATTPPTKKDRNEIIPIDLIIKSSI